MRHTGSFLILLGCTLSIVAPATAHGQRAATLEAVRVHRANALALAESDLATCAPLACPDQARLTLLVGYLRLSSGDTAGARTLLSDPAAAPPLLEPFRAYYRGEAEFYSRAPAAAAKSFGAALPLAPPSLATRVRARLGEALLASGDAKAALPVLEQAAGEQESPELYQARSDARRATGDVPGARADQKRLATGFPLHPYGRAAMAALEALPGPPPLNFGERLQRAWALLDGSPEDALDEVKAIQKLKLDRARGAEARVAAVSASALYALGRDEEAEAAVARALKGPPDVAAEAALAQARRTLRKHDNPKAREQFAQVDQRYPKSSAAQEAGFLAGWLDFQADAFARAITTFTAFEQRHPRSRRIDDVRWYRALALIRLARYGEASVALEALARQFPSSSLVPQSLYWAARSEQLGGASAAAVAPSYRKVISQFPGGFYAWLALERLRELKQETPEMFPSAPRALPVAVPGPLKVALALSQSGLFRDAALEVQQQIRGVRAVEQALQYGHALQSLGEYGLAHALAARTLWGQAYNQQTGEALALFYPRAFAPSVEAECQRQGIDPALLWAIMRRESAFKPEVLSAANARGLLQLIPSTGAEIAKELKETPPDPDELYSPALNIHLGAWYVSQLQRRFQHPALIAAAYNAGPTATLRWTQDRGTLPLDLFVEMLSYRETRAYVKQVVADMNTYRALYGATPAATLDLLVPTPADGGVSF